MSEYQLLKKRISLGKRGFPTTALFECTYRCNARCDYCYNEKTTEELSTEKATAVLNKLDAAGIVTLVISGGEPFVRKDILTLLENALRLNFFRIGLMTNALAFTSEHLHFLINHSSRFHEVSVSIFSHNQEINDKIFGVKGALETTLYNCDHLIKAGIPVHAKINVRPDNFQSCRGTIKFLEERGFKVGLYPYTGLLTSSQSSYAIDAVKHFSECRKVFARYKSKRSSTHSSGTLCSGINTHITINPAGLLRPCVAFKDAFIGDILNPRPLHEILNSSAPLKKLQTMRKNDIRKCRDCSFFDSCLPCLAHVYNYNKNLEQAPPLLCKQIKSMKLHKFGETA